MYKKYGEPEIKWLKDRLGAEATTHSAYQKAKTMLPEFVAKFNKPTTLAGFRNFIDRTLNPERHQRYQKNYLNRQFKKGKAEKAAPSVCLNLEGDAFLLITKKLGAKGFPSIEKVKEYMLGNGITGAKLFSINPININVDIRIDGEGEGPTKK